MKKIKVKLNEEQMEVKDKDGNVYRNIDSGQDDSLEVMNEELVEFGLTLIVGDLGDDSDWICITRR